MNLSEKLKTASDNCVAIAKNIGAEYGKGSEEGYKKHGDLLVDMLHRPTVNNKGKQYYFNRMLNSNDFTGYTFTKTLGVGKPIGSLQYCFYNYRGTALPGNMDFSSAIEGVDMKGFLTYATELIEFPDIKLPPIRTSFILGQLDNLQKIEILRFAPLTPQPFELYHAPKLHHLRIEGEFTGDTTIVTSPLDADSVKNIISCLKDYSGTENAGVYTLALSATAKSNVEAEGATSPNGNTWLQYAVDKGWNI